MHTRPSLYRSTLIGAAVAIGCFGAAAAQAHDYGWHGQERGWHERGWRDRGEQRGWHRGYYGPRYGYAAPGWVAYGAPAVYGGYGPPLAFGPGGVSVVVRLPF